jgi:hypothetical protein
MAFNLLEKDNQTFKIRRADYSEIWEISFLLNVQPEFNKTLDSIKGNILVSYIILNHSEFFWLFLGKR